ncbi:hypothetical protein [Burkholderia multivorans]|uniref:hypothetical protein n=1 Tax=Burkholderia multivorans TaxID=87883 RepID=UPI00158AD268|nr:hypothetical protein [Burkholderia multivorans]MBU9203088.1 hypothetical protein [Burkholderia multivorans]MBU9211848.1 hypothetical protein [Burkholderia multivorans]MBU9649386.1 hypothetical protein [Burkholderia multivorans]MDN8047598.1 hypothetical protein [Burkholderia multivorans]HEM7842612.1 hypothetical protein [Burkholderia multivorans]
MNKFEIAVRVRGVDDGSAFWKEVMVDCEGDAQKLSIQWADHLKAAGHQVCASLIKQDGRWVGLCPAKA